MSAIVLYRVHPAERMHRYYRMNVQQDLFGYWCLVREWGRMGRHRPGAQHPLPRSIRGAGSTRKATSS